MSRFTKTTITVAVLMVVIVAMGAPAMAQPQPTIAMTYLIDVVRGQNAEFEDGVKKQLEWMRKNDETWVWNFWQIRTGPNTGQYVARSPNHYWKDMDDHAEMGQKGSLHFREVAGAHVESVQGIVMMFLAEASRWAPDRTTPAMVTVYDFDLKWGKQEQFMHAAAKISKAVAEADIPMEYAWLAAISGAEGSKFRLVIPHDNWADMGGPEGGFWAMLEQHVGRADADAMRLAMDDCIINASAFLASHRPDLSYTPSGN